MIKRALRFLFPLDLIRDESGFLPLLFGAAKVAAPFLGKLFGGGPTFQDLPQSTRDISQLTVDALKQAQGVRGGQLDLSRALESIDVDNARSIGAFNPASLGPAFDFLSPTVSQFSNADFGANAIRQRFDRDNQLLALTNQIGSLAPQFDLGANQILNSGAAQAGGGLGSAIGSALGQLGNQMQMGTGLGALLSGLGGGGAGAAPGGTARGFSFGTPGFAGGPALGGGVAVPAGQASGLTLGSPGFDDSFFKSIVQQAIQQAQGG